MVRSNTGAILKMHIFLMSVFWLVDIMMSFCYEQQVTLANKSKNNRAIRPLHFTTSSRSIWLSTRRDKQSCEESSTTIVNILSWCQKYMCSRDTLKYSDIMSNEKVSWFLNVRTYRLFLTYRKLNTFCFWTVWQNILASGDNRDGHL